MTQGPDRDACDLRFPGLQALRLIRREIERTRLDLTGLRVLTEAAVGYRRLTPAIAALAGADACLTSLPKPEHVSAVYGGDDGIFAHAEASTVLMDTSTVDVETSRWCHSEAEARGLTFVDAPISGGTAGAEAGTLTFMLGGAPDDVARAAEIVDPMAGNVIACGEAGAGIAAKLVNNMMLFIGVMAVSEGSQLAEQLGLGQVEMKHAVVRPAFLDPPGERLHCAEQLDDLGLGAFGVALENPVGQFVGQPGLGTDDTVGEAAMQNLPCVIVRNVDALGESRLVRLEAANTVAEDFRQHGNRLARQVDAVASKAGLLIQRRAGRDKVADVGDVHAEHPVAVGVAVQADRVVEVLGIRRIDRDDHLVADVLSLGAWFGAEGRGGAARLFQALLIECSRQMELPQNRLDFRLVPPGAAEHLDDHTPRQVLLIRIRQDLDDNLVFLLGVLGRDVFDDNRLDKPAPIRLNDQRLRMPGQGPDELIVGSFEHLDDLTRIPGLASPHAFARRLGKDGVAGHGVACAVGGDEQIAVRIRFERHDEAETFGVLAEGADNLAGHGGQSHEVAASDDDVPGAAQLFEGRFEFRIGVRLHAQRFGQLRHLHRGVIGMLEQLDNPVSIHVRHRPLQ